MYANKAHRAAYAAGQKAQQSGRPRFAPYGIENRSSREFRRAWLAGYDANVACLALADQLSSISKAGRA